MISVHYNAEFDFSHGMYAVITGSSSALPDPDRGNASAAVVVDGCVLQFDCGRGAMEGLCRSGINPLDVDYLFFTHLHFDHVANYGYFLMSSWIAGRQTRLEIYGPSGTKDFSDKIINAHSVDSRFFGHIIDGWPSAASERPLAELPAEVHEFAERGVVLSTADVSVTSVETPHYREMGIVSFGYRVDSKYGSVVVTGDGRPSPGMIELARHADLLIHECAKPDPGMIAGGKFSDEGEGYEPNADGGWTGGHTTPTWLGQLASAAEVRKVVATHLPPLSAAPAAAQMSRFFTGGLSDHTPAVWDDVANRIRRSFSGDVIVARDGMVFRIGK